MDRERDSGDYITIYDDGNEVITHLSGLIYCPVDGYTINIFGHYIPTNSCQKKIISSSSDRMLIEFRSDAFEGPISTGFSASIHYSPLPIKECQNGLNMTKKTIQSPNYPNSYNNNIECKWLISVTYGFHITLNFSQLDVR